MFAVIKTGGKQYRVAAEQELKIEKIEGAVGDIVTIGSVLAHGNGDDVTIGAPFVDGASVAAEIVAQGHAKTVIAFKKRRRQNSRRRIGHRQLLTTVRISEILIGGAKPSKAAAAKPARKADAEAAPATAAPLFTAPAGKGDKLVDIKGIGPVAAKQLAEQGITTFKQLAELTDADIEKIDANMPFSADQIRDWQGQAKELAK
jgi:large subunit ribosomal protein L21